MKELRILFTGVGRRVELIQCFRNASEKININLIIYGADITTTAPALYYCNKQLIVPRIDNCAYIPTLLEICKVEKIDAIIPTIDTDLTILAENKKKFFKVNTKVIISDYLLTKACFDKELTSKLFIECGLNTPMTVDDYTKYDRGFPAFIKPISGSSAINTFKVNNSEELKECADRIGNYIVQPFIQGTEYSVDVFCDFKSNPILMTARKRLQMRTGEVIKTQVVHDEKIIDEINKLTEKNKFIGQISVQFIREEKTKKDYYIEINGRFGGGSPLSMMAGANSAEMLLKLLCDEKVETQKFVAVENMYYSRFDQSVLIPNKDYKRNIKAVIFDLDDTLYSEKEYVKSGFINISRLLPNVKDCFDKLLRAYENGKPAIDFVLKTEKIYTEELKEKCLNIYRNQIPNIHLFSDVESTIKELKNRGIKIGIITDGNPVRQKNKINILGLDKLVDEIIVTEEIGGEKFRKPCDISFRIMQRKMDLSFEQIAYIGDNLDKDFIAPIELNMMPVYIDRKDKIYSFENVPEYILKIKTLDELLEKV